MNDTQLTEMIERIKETKPLEPASDNCIDFELGDSGYGVRVVLTYEGEWMVSTSIGSLYTKQVGEEKYIPLDLDQWTTPLRQSATQVIQEVLEHFNIDPTSKRAEQGGTVVLFRFKERVVQ